MIKRMQLAASFSSRLVWILEPILKVMTTTKKMKDPQRTTPSRKGPPFHSVKDLRRMESIIFLISSWCTTPHSTKDPCLWDSKYSRSTCHLPWLPHMTATLQLWRISIWVSRPCKGAVAAPVSVLQTRIPWIKIRIKSIWKARVPLKRNNREGLCPWRNSSLSSCPLASDSTLSSLRRNTLAHL